MSHALKLRRTTMDRAPPDNPDAIEIHTSETLGDKRARTPNGNLICYDVPIRRTGWLLYGPGEVDVEVNEMGYSRIYVGEDELFTPTCLGSFMGVAVCDEHPPGGDINPKNWADLGKGFTINVRRGKGEDADVMLADLVITDDELIEKILKGKVEVSAGYDASYHDDGDGKGRQYDIIGNHVALVERGRCGPRCAIGDQAFQPPAKETKMPQARVRLNPQQRVQLKKRFQDFAEEFLEETGDPSMPDGEHPPGGEPAGANGTHIHLHMSGSGPTDPGIGGLPAAPGGADPTTDNLGDPAAPSQPADGSGDLGNRVAALEAGQKQILAMLQQLTGATGDAGPDADPEADPAADPNQADPAANGEEPKPFNDEMPEELEEMPAGRTTDSAALATSYQQLLSDAEILFPGYRAPTFDAACKRQATVDRMCAIRRKVLDHAYATQGGKALVDSITGKPALTLDTMSCVQVANTFRAAVGAQRAINNAAAKGTGKLPTPTMDSAPKQKTLADINKANQEFWNKRQAA